MPSRKTLKLLALASALLLAACGDPGKVPAEADARIRRLVAHYDELASAHRFEPLLSLYAEGAQIKLKNPFIDELMKGAPPATDEDKAMVARIRDGSFAMSPAQMIDSMRDAEKGYSLTRSELVIKRGDKPDQYLVTSKIRETVCTGQTCVAPFSSDEMVVLSTADGTHIQSQQQTALEIPRPVKQ